MTVQLDWPRDVVDQLTDEARKKGLSLDAYLLQTVLEHKGSNGAPTSDAEKRLKRAEAGARILEIQSALNLIPRCGLPATTSTMGAVDGGGRH